MLAKNPRIDAKHLVRDDDVPWVRVTADTPVACQIDGDYVGQRETMTFTVGPGCAWRGGATGENRLTCECAVNRAELGRK